MNWTTLLLVLASVMTICECPSFAGSSESFTQVQLAVGKLYIPESYKPINGSADILVHFHGAESVVPEKLVQSGKKACLVIVNMPGLSETYAKPFRDDPRLFSRMLGEARQKLTEHFGDPIRIRKLVISSFSAGYGAVREILKSAEYLGLISDIVLADSLYAGYLKQNGKNVPNPAHMKNFSVFARLAAGGRKTMIVTHSQLVPGTYASTIETADVLIAAAHTVRIPKTGTDGTGMQMESVADRGKFHVRSYQGTTGEAHMTHLRQMQEALKLTSLP